MSPYYTILNRGGKQSSELLRRGYEYALQMIRNARLAVQAFAPEEGRDFSSRFRIAVPGVISNSRQRREFKNRCRACGDYPLKRRQIWFGMLPRYETRYGFLW